MMIIGCDFHPSWQQVCWLDTETGETGERKLVHAEGDAERFYRQVKHAALVGMEATGNSHWLVDLLAEIGHELWVGDAAQIRASYVRQQKTDKRDAAHIMKLLAEGRFPRIWMPSSEVRDLQIEPLDAAVKAEALRDKMALLLQSQPGVGPVTSLAYVLTMGDVSRFPRGKQVASYLGLIPREHSSGGRQKLGAITKQGNRMLRMLLVEAAQTTVRLDPGFRKQYLHRCHQKPKGVAKLAAARKLAVRLYWMLRTQTGYPEIVRIESSPRVPLVGAS